MCSQGSWGRKEGERGGHVQEDGLERTGREANRETLRWTEAPAAGRRHSGLRWPKSPVLDRVMSQKKHTPYS